jgi:hypothetical protein
MKGVFECVDLQLGNIFKDGHEILQEIRKEVQVIVVLFQEIPAILPFESKCQFVELQHFMEHLR